MWQSTAMMVVCLVDTYYTLAIVELGWAVEANPMLAKLLESGNLPFLFVKGLSFLIPVGLIELVRPYSPRFIPKLLGSGVALYLLTYLVGSILLHR